MGYSSGLKTGHQRRIDRYRKQAKNRNRIQAVNTENNGKGVAQLLFAALHFAARKHSGQRRKDSGAAPYINHLIAVTEILARVGGVTNMTILQAAILHDTLEDTQTTAQELDEHFGNEVRSLVQELTDDKRLPKQERKRLQVNNAPRLSAAAKQLKMADKISNLGDISSTQPADWSFQRKIEYLEWAERVVAGCRGTNAELEHHFDAVLQERRNALEATSRLKKDRRRQS
jgi:(p)ppGpp synthase/HD superfamily hydrolase